MTRRGFLVILVASTLFPAVVTAANRRFVFKIKTKDGSIIGNIVIEAKDMEAAKYKLRKRYPNCEILEAQEK